MRKLYEIFKVLKIQKRIVSPETICGNTVVSHILFTEFVKKRGNSLRKYGTYVPAKPPISPASVGPPLIGFWHFSRDTHLRYLLQPRKIT